MPDQSGRCPRCRPSLDRQNKRPDYSAEHFRSNEPDPAPQRNRGLSVGLWSANYSLQRRDDTAARAVSSVSAGSETAPNSFHDLWRRLGLVEIEYRARPREIDKLGRGADQALMSLEIAAQHDHDAAKIRAKQADELAEIGVPEEVGVFRRDTAW